MSVVNGLFFDDLGRATLSQVEQNLQEVVEARFAARFLYPDVEQCVDAIFVGEPLLSLDRVVADAKVAKELLVIVHVEFLKILKAVAQWLFACKQRNTPSVTASTKQGRTPPNPPQSAIIRLLLDLVSRSYSANIRIGHQVAFRTNISHQLNTDRVSELENKDVIPLTAMRWGNCSSSWNRETDAGYMHSWNGIRSLSQLTCNRESWNRVEDVLFYPRWTSFCGLIQRLSSWHIASHKPLVPPANTCFLGCYRYGVFQERGGVVYSLWLKCKHAGLPITTPARLHWHQSH